MVNRIGRSLPESQRCGNSEERQVLEAVVHAKEASQDEGCEQQGEADGELLLLGDGGSKGLARRGVPEILERRGRH